MDLATVGPWVVAVLLGLDRGVSVARRLWVLPREIRDGIEDIGEDLYARKVAEETRATLLAQLAPIAAHQEEILALLKPNAGSSLKDAVTRLEQQLAAHAEESQTHVQLLHELRARLDAHIALTLDGPS